MGCLEKLPFLLNNNEITGLLQTKIYKLSNLAKQILYK